MNWNLAEIISINNNEVKFRTINKNKKNLEDFLYIKNIKWTLGQNKLLQDIHQIGDVIFCKKIK